MNTLTDNQLMLAVKEGSTEKLGVLYERYKQWLYRFFLQLNADSELSEDLVQNVFVRILKYKHTFSEDSKYVTWMFQIARNANNDHFRKRSNKQKKEDLDVVSYRLTDSDGVDADIEKNESTALLHQALQKLPADKREILVLCKLKELRYKEVAQIVGCTEDTARMKAHRALKELKTIYLSLELN